MKELIQKKIQVLQNQLLLTEANIYQLKEQHIGIQNQLQPLRELENEMALVEKLEKEEKKKEAAKRLKKHEPK